MLHTDRGALLCDLAETYNIYDIKAHPATRIALFSAGLRDNSRIKMKLSGMRTSNEILLLAYAVDRLSVLIWQNTKDGQKGKNRPKSIADAILNGDMVKQHRTTGFDTPEAFMNAREKIIERR